MSRCSRCGRKDGSLLCAGCRYEADADEAWEQYEAGLARDRSREYLGILLRDHAANLNPSEEPATDD